MDFSGIASGGLIVPITALIAVLLVIGAVVWYARRSTARMARRHNAWVEQLPAATRSRARTHDAQEIGGGQEPRAMLLDSAGAATMPGSAAVRPTLSRPTRR